MSPKPASRVTSARRSLRQDRYDFRIGCATEPLLNGCGCIITCFAETSGNLARQVFIDLELHELALDRKGNDAFAR